MSRQASSGMMKRMLGVSAAGLALLVPLGGAIAQVPADAAPAAAPAASAANAPSTNAMVNLIRLLVQQKTITQANGDALIAQAEADAAQARSTIVQAASNAGVPPPPEGTVRVPYVPETVRRQIAEQVRGEVMAKAKAEGWAAPGNAAPDWTRRIKITGDVRVRSQSDLYAKQNDDKLINIAAFNAASGGFNFNRDFRNLPYLNTTQDRVNRLRVRARVGVEADISPVVEAGFRLATGDDNSPISTNQNLAGGLTKRSIWLDRAYVKLRPTDWLTASAGRFANPFRSTDLLFDEDLNFDGVAVEARADKWLPDGFKLAVRGGAFPLDFGSPDYPSASQAKSAFSSKWLFSGQVEGSYTMDNGIVFSGATAIHIFHNVQGRQSAPCFFNGTLSPLGTDANGTTINDPAQCSSDDSATFGARKGNTYFFIRQLATTDGRPDTIINKRQLLGLTYRYNVLDINASVKVPLDDEIVAVLSGNYIRNLAFRRRDECRYGVGFGPVTNLQFNSQNDACLATNPSRVVSGNMGWAANLMVGYPHPDKWGEWRVQAGYRYLQSDATLDSLTDSDFHLGGTNSKGYTIGGWMGLTKGLTMGARWMSANEVSGSPLAIDVLQFDLMAEF